MVVVIAWLQEELLPLSFEPWLKVMFLSALFIPELLPNLCMAKLCAQFVLPASAGNDRVMQRVYLDSHESRNSL